MGAKKLVPRTPTRDLTVGLGLFRWGDDKKTIKKAIPNADWTFYEAMYLMQRVFYVDEFLELAPGLHVAGCIDPGEKEDEQVVRIEMFDRVFDGREGAEVWGAFASLCGDLGNPGLSLPPSGRVSWANAGATLELDAGTRSATLSIVRPKSAS